MSRHDEINRTILGTILCLSVLALPSHTHALTYQIDPGDGGREEWHGPGDPEGGDRYSGDLIHFQEDTVLRSAAEPADERDEVPSIRIIRLGYSILLIIEAGESRQAYPILLSR